MRKAMNSAEVWREAVLLIALPGWVLKAEYFDRAGQLLRLTPKAVAKAATRCGRKIASSTPPVRGRACSPKCTRSDRTAHASRGRSLPTLTA